MSRIRCPAHFHIVGIDYGIAQYPDIRTALPSRYTGRQAVFRCAIDYVDMVAFLDVNSGAPGVSHVNIPYTYIRSTLDLDQAIVPWIYSRIGDVDLQAIQNHVGSLCATYGYAVVPRVRRLSRSLAAPHFDYNTTRFGYVPASAPAELCTIVHLKDFEYGTTTCIYSICCEKDRKSMVHYGSFPRFRPGVDRSRS